MSARGSQGDGFFHALLRSRHRLVCGLFSPLRRRDAGRRDWARCISPRRRRASESRKDLPECKIICSFRDPVERAYSNYRLLRRMFHQGRFRTRGDHARRSARIEPLRNSSGGVGSNTFGRERVLVLIYDDLESNPQAFLDSVCDFIGIARFPISASRVGAERVNTVNTQPPNPRLAKIARDVVAMVCRRAAIIARRIWCARARSSSTCSKEAIRFLRSPRRWRGGCASIYRPEVEKLEKLIGRDFRRGNSPRRSVGASDLQSARVERAWRCGEQVQLSCDC